MWYLAARIIEEFRAEKGYHAGLLNVADSEHISEDAKKRIADELTWCNNRMNEYV